MPLWVSIITINHLPFTAIFSRSIKNTPGPGLRDSTFEVPRDLSKKLVADFMCDNGVVEVSLLHV